MDAEQRLKTFEEDLAATRDELKQLLMDLRGFLLSAKNPLGDGSREDAPHDAGKENQ